MKINRLYTLSQFVELLDKQEYEHFITLEDLQSEKFEQIIKYNDFLKQPLKKEMFVIESPIIGWADGDEGELQRIRAEKKVIFDLAQIKNLNMCEYDLIKRHNTIEDLANYSAIQLKTKNIEI